MTTTNIATSHSVEIGSVRIRRGSDSFRVWDLTNAGKRGKRVATASLEPTYSFRGDRACWMDSMAKALAGCESYAAVRALVADLLVDFPGELRFEEREARGVDVAPAGDQELVIKTSGGLTIRASARDFSVTSTVLIGGKGTRPGFKQDTLYSPAGRGVVATRKSSAAFFAWLRSNLSRVESMTIQDLCAIWRELGVAYTYH